MPVLGNLLCPSVFPTGDGTRSRAGFFVCLKSDSLLRYGAESHWQIIE